jgi:hypothetical protein
MTTSRQWYRLPFCHPHQPCACSESWWSQAITSGWEFGLFGIFEYGLLNIRPDALYYGGVLPPFYPYEQSKAPVLGGETHVPLLLLSIPTGETEG